ncbi:MAG: two-component response regulator [Armatimonadetes bacterium CSP1-3]|nr:MAG: two-component response regulator [Armatimonadetes bacterium CSP1-3]
MNILVVEDDARSRELLVRYLSAKGHAVATAEDGNRALESVAASEPDLVLLDGNLPVMDGWAVLEALRKFSRVPVIMVTVRDATRDKLAGLGLGADDYITKPFDLRELEARIQAVMRRYQAQAASAGVIRTGEVVVDDERKEVTVRGKPVKLSPREFGILRLLTSRPGKVFSSAEILAAAWPDREGATVEDVKKYIHMLRRKIERDPAKPRIIVTVRGFGYRLSAEAP